MTVTTELLTAAEGRTLDWKRDLSSPRPILRTLVAFANTAGGTLIVGRDDDGALCGVPDPKKAADWLANIIADGIAPALFPDIETETVDGKHLVIVRVARWIGPFHVVADGKERGTYVRLGATNRHADERTLEELNRQARQQAFDELPCLGAEIADLDQAALAKAFAAKGREIDTAKLQTLGVLTRYGKHLLPSNGGVILFGKDEIRRDRFPSVRVRCARFEGNTKAQFLDRQDLEGKLIDAIDDMLKFVRRNTRLAGRIESVRRRNIPEYPQVALREALVNAIAHALCEALHKRCYAKEILMQSRLAEAA
jgi:predicted HTH transcriptional regulator